MVGEEGRLTEDVTSDVMKQVASPAITDVPPRGTSVDARLQALVQRILSQTVKRALCQHVDEATDTQNSKRQKTQSVTPSGSKDGRFKKPSCPTRLGQKSTGPIVDETVKCNGCHEPGHYQAACPFKRTACFVCGGCGHRQRFCPISGKGPTYEPTIEPRSPVPKIEHPTQEQIVGEGRLAKDITSDDTNQVASPATTDVVPLETSVDDARVQALVQRILSHTVKLALCQPMDQARDTQSSKRQNTQSTAPSGSMDGGFKKPRCPTGSGKKSTRPIVDETLKCYGCHEPGHYQAACPFKHVACFVCGGCGHRRRFCPRSGRGPTYEPTIEPRPPVPKIEHPTQEQMVGEGRLAEDVTSDATNQAASPATSGSKDGGFKKPRCPTGSGKKSSGRIASETLKCYGCHEPGHYQSVCPRKGTTCFICGGRGHRQPFCPRRVPEDQLMSQLRHRDVREQYR